MNMLKNSIKNITILLFLLSPNIYFAFLTELNNSIAVNYLLTSLVYVLPIFFILIYWEWTKIGVFILSLFFIISLVETTMIVLFKNYILAGNILSVINTNNEEAGSFFANSIKLTIYWIPIVILFVVAIHSYRKRENILNGKFKLLVILGSFLLAFGFIFYKINLTYKRKLTYSYFVPTRILNRSPFNFFYQVYNVYDYYRLRGYIEESENCSFASTKQDSLKEKEIYILAIGESLRYDNLSLNGVYERETTPNLEKEENLILFDNYYSTSCLTMFSVPQIITRATPENYELNYKEKSIFLPFKETGFKTYCICWKNLLSYETYLTKGVDSLIIVEKDKEIVDWVNQLSEKNDKVFFILQFLGNHSFYYNYEVEFERYKPNINNYSEKEKNSDSLYINAYDNTILYTDYILSEIINTLKMQNAVGTMLFISDHGENVTKTGGGHGGDCSPVKTEYHVPLIVWYSDLYEKYYSDKTEIIKANKTKKLNANNIFYTVLDLAHISIEKEKSNETMAISNQNFKEAEKRFVLLPDGKNIFEVK
mgnify:CR=1 FL=1